MLLFIMDLLVFCGRNVQRYGTTRNELVRNKRKACDSNGFKPFLQWYGNGTEIPIHHSPLGGREWWWGFRPAFGGASMTPRFGGNQPAAGMLVCENRGWELFDLGDIDTPWRRFKLVAKTKQRKANYWFSFNGERVAMGKDAVLLNTHFQDVFDWVLESLKGAEK